MEASLRVLTAMHGECERLALPMPFIYVVHLRSFLLFYLLTLPLVLNPALGWPVALIVLAVSSYGILGLENAAVQMENPFGTDSNDLPLDDFCNDIQLELREVIGDSGSSWYFEGGSQIFGTGSTDSLASPTKKSKGCADDGVDGGDGGAGD